MKIEDENREGRQKAPEHVPENWLYLSGNNIGTGGHEVNEIIEEIMVILIKRRITITTAKHILKDTMDAIENEAILGDRKVQGEIIRADQ